jgi:F-type H+-transporting ATPase subunit delta
VYGPKIDIEFESKPELIGGVRIKIGSDVYDGTVRSRLAELEKQF